MSTLIVEVCRIERVMPHGNADALELAHIKGWQCVVPKGRYKAGDRVVYVPLDSVLPVELSEKLGVTKYLSKQRVRCARLRGEPSFGLVFDPERQDWEPGTDVKDHYGITKYVPPFKASAGDAEAPHPLFERYTEIENLRNFPDVILPGEEVVATEKVHGTNCRVGLIEGRLMAGSMEVQRKRPADDQMSGSIYWSPLTQEPVRNLLTELGKSHAQVVLFGEVYGAKIQSLTYGVARGTLGFAAFDLLVDGRYLDHAVFVALCRQHSVPAVPTLWVGPFDIEQVRHISGGKTVFAGADHIREGVVVRPAVERRDPKVGRVILKYLSDEYLLMKEGGGITDADDV